MRAPERNLCLPSRQADHITPSSTTSNTYLQRPILPQHLIAPRLPRQTRQTRRVLTRLPSAHRARPRHLDPLDRIRPRRVPLHLRLSLSPLLPILPSHPCRRVSTESRRSSRRTRRLGGGLQGFQEGDDGFGGEVLVEVVVDLDHGCVDAGAETFDFDEGEEAVLCGLPAVDAEVAFDGLLDDVGAAAAELAGRLVGGDGVSDATAIGGFLGGERGTGFRTVVQSCR